MIEIVMASDSNYFQHMAVAIMSILSNTNEKTSFHILVSEKSDKQKLILDMVEGHNCTLEFLCIEDMYIDSFKLAYHFTKEAYYRIKIPELFPQLEKVIYIDCDLVVEGNIEKLWEIDIGDYPVAAVVNPFFTRGEVLGINDPEDYFNSGVLVINIQYWNRNKIISKIISYIILNSNIIEMIDQDALNAVLHLNWYKLDCSWNLQRSMLIGDCFPVPDNCINIIHFTTGSKPWHYLDEHPYKNRYYKYLKLTPWANEKPQGFSLIGLVKKIIRRIRKILM